MQIPPNSRKAGISLVEVLVLLLIISVLAFLLLPHLGRMVEKSRDSQCVARLKNFHTGFMLYSAEHNGEIPPYRVFTPLPDGTTHRGDFWSTQIKPYISPDAPWGKHILCPSEKVLPSNHYAMNSNISYGPGMPPERLNSIPLPSKRFLMGDGNATSRITAGNFIAETMFRHSGDTMNILFLDGHVEGRILRDVPIPANGFSSATPEYKAFWHGTQ